MPKRKKEHHSYLGCMEEIHYDSEWIDMAMVIQLKKYFSGISNALAGIAPAFFIMDYARKGYTTIADSVFHISGYRPEAFLDGGVDFLLDIYHRDDFEVYNKQIFHENAQFLKTIPSGRHQEYLFTYNFRFRARDKGWCCVQQKNIYLTFPETGIPRYCIGVVYDVSGLKKDSVMYHRIEHQQGERIVTAVENYFYPDPQDQVLSKRELEIARYIAEGYNTTALAKKFFLSEHTVAIHRRNMLRKTNTKNVAAFIRYLIERRIV